MLNSAAHEKETVFSELPQLLAEVSNIKIKNIIVVLHTSNFTGAEKRGASTRAYARVQEEKRAEKLS